MSPTTLARTLFLILSLAVFSSAVWAQNQNHGAARGILGYLDPQTGTFRPVPTVAAEGDADIAAATTLGGTITVTLTITLKTTAITTVTCTAEVSAIDNITASPVSFGETDTVAGTGTGSTRTCKLTIPYAWSLVTPSTDSMSTSYFVTGGASTTGLPQRSSSRSPLDTRKVPGNGVITTLSAAVTL
jgi:hypothetical protein